MSYQLDRVEADAMPNDNRTHQLAAASLAWWLKRWLTQCAAELERQARELEYSARRMRGER